MAERFSGMEISTCEMHTCGEPLRIVEKGIPEIRGRTILEKIAFLRENHDHIRRFLMHEPRGHYDMYGTIKVQPDIDGADVAFIFMHNEGYSTMCGHAVIALGRYCVDNGLVKVLEPETQIHIQCPCGLVPAYVTVKNGHSSRVRFHSVPSFVFTTGLNVKIPELGRSVKVDIAYGGAFYAIISAQELGIDIGVGHCRKAVSIGNSVKEVIKSMVNLEHPDSDDLAFLYGTIIVDLSEMDTKNLVRQMIVFADSELDRSPCGSGTSAHVALLYDKGKVAINRELVFQSAVNDTQFSAKAIKSATCGRFQAVTVEVAGNAHYSGRSTFTAECDDPLISGFLVK